MAFVSEMFIYAKGMDSTPMAEKLLAIADVSIGNVGQLAADLLVATLQVRSAITIPFSSLSASGICACTVRTKTQKTKLVHIHQQKSDSSLGVILLHNVSYALET
jgi:hypothetical protein